MMNENDDIEEENEVTMEVENVGEYLIQMAEPPYLVQIARPPDEIHPLALVAINVPRLETVENRIEVLPPVDNELFEEVEPNLEERISPATSTVSSRIPSPSIIEEESIKDALTTDVNESAQASRKRTHEDDISEDDGAMCPICLDNWTNTGDHRICALKCGHLFGYKCINEWLSRQRRGTCPTCKKKAKSTDIRYVYAKRLIAVDTTELESVKQQLERVTEERNKAQTDLAKYACREYMLTQEIVQLKAQLNNYTRKANSNMSSVNQPPELVRLYMEKSMEVCKYGGSRVFDANCERDLLMASMKSTTNLFMGFGLKKISMSNYRAIAFIPAHASQIRDVCFHQDNNWILSASMDKSFKVIDNTTNTVIYQFSHQMPLWSCCWDQNNPYVLYVGTQSGAVIKYDVRNLSEPVMVLSIEGDMSPVVSVASIPACPGEPLPQGGIVSCKLNSLWLYENVNDDYVRHAVPLDGPFVSMKYQPNSRQLLVSSRPNNRIMYSRHTLCTFEKRDQDKIDCNIVHSFRGGGMQKLLSKSCFLSHNNDYVAAHQEDSRCVFLWSINTGEKVCSLPAHETVLDLKGIQNQNGSFLLSLTEKKLEFFKFI